MPKPPTQRSRGGYGRDWNGYRHPSMDYRPPKLLRRVNAGMVLLLSTLLVVGLWSGGWYVGAAYLKAQVMGWTTRQAEHGAIADYESLELSGYPTRIVLTLNGPRYEGTLVGENVVWRGERLILTTRPWRPWVFHVEAPGRHELNIGEGRLAFSGTVQALDADIDPRGPWPERLDLAVEGLTLGGRAPMGVQNLTLSLVHDADVKAGGTGLALTLAAHDLTLPTRDWGVGTTLKTLETSMRVVGPVLPGNLAERLEAWRSVGGALKVDRLRLRLGPLGVAAVGTLALDENFQPAGTFTAKFEGLFQALEVLRAQGLVRDGNAVLATMALAALSRRPADGGPAFINLAVTLQGGKVRLGPIEIMDLPSFAWVRAPQPASEPQSERDYKDSPAVY